MDTRNGFCSGVMMEPLENRMMLSVAHPAAAKRNAHHPAAHHRATQHAKAKKNVASNALPLAASKTAERGIFMTFGDVKGDTKVGGLDNVIELNSFQWGVARTIASPNGDFPNREGSAPTLSDITITKTMDETSQLLLREALVGQAKDVKIYFVNTVKGKPSIYAEYDLTNVLISSYSVSSGGDTPSESISLNFSKVEFTAFQPKGKPVTKTIWDIAENVAA